jgi:hypothetical protein
LIVTDCELKRPAPLVAEHVRLVPGVSLDRLIGEHEFEEATPDSGSVALQVTVTLLWYQPFVPMVPLMVGVISGGVVSVIALHFPADPALKIA